MCWERIKNEICVEVNAMDEEGTEVIIRKIVGDIGIHEAYMNIYNKLTNMSKMRIVTGKQIGRAHV